MYSRDVRFNENEKDSELPANRDVDHHLVLDFSSDCETEAPTEGQSPDEGIPEQVHRRSNFLYRVKVYSIECRPRSELHIVNEVTCYSECCVLSGLDFEAAGGPVVCYYCLCLIASSYKQEIGALFWLNT